MSATGSPGAGIRGGVFGAALSRAVRVLSAVGGDVALHEAASARKVARSPSENDCAATTGGSAVKNLQLPDASILFLKSVRFLCQIRRPSRGRGIPHGCVGQKSILFFLTQPIFLKKSIYFFV